MQANTSPPSMLDGETSKSFSPFPISKRNFGCFN